MKTTANGNQGSKCERTCVCGCGRSLPGSSRMRRHPECRVVMHRAAALRWRERSRLDPEYRKRQADRAMRKYNANPEAAKKAMRERARASHRRNRLAAIEAYGGRCRCCGETRWQFLTLSHSNGDGAAHRKELVGRHHRTSAAKFLRKLAAAGFPQDRGLEILCANCHNAIDMFGGCPHDEERLAKAIMAGEIGDPRS